MIEFVSFRPNAFYQNGVRWAPKRSYDILCRIKYPLVPFPYETAVRNETTTSLFSAIHKTQQISQIGCSPPTPSQSEVCGQG